VGCSKTLALHNRQGVARLNSDGTLDETFDAGPAVDATEAGGAYPAVTALAVQRDGRILLAGTFLKVAETQRPYIGRLFGGDLPDAPSIVIGPSNRTAMAEQTIEFAATPASISNSAPHSMTVYHLEATDSLLPAKWEVVNTFTGDGGIKEINLPAGLEQRYFRLHLK
jgi:hypothetical protein